MRAKRQIAIVGRALAALVIAAGAAYAHNIPTVDWRVVVVNFVVGATGLLVGGALGTLAGLALAATLEGHVCHLIERLQRPCGRLGVLFANVLSVLALGAVVVEDSDRRQRPLRYLGGVGGALIGAAVGYHVACLARGEPGIW